jgi:hypothetical protein
MAHRSGEARNLQVGGHVTIFEFLGGHKLKILKICLSICTYVRGFRNFWVGLCPPDPYSGFATDKIKRNEKLENNNSFD